MVHTTQVWTDGHGTYQARCPHCGYRGRWFRVETKAADEAKEHGKSCSEAIVSQAYNRYVR